MSKLNVDLDVGNVRIVGDSLSKMPWQDKPEGSEAPVWRHTENPVIGRNPVPGIARIFNSAVAPYEGRFVGIFRAETINGRPHLHLGWSDDGLAWDIETERLHMVDEEGNEYQPNYAYDPRLVRVEDTYYIIWCTDFYGAALGIAQTKDFKSFVRLENPFLPFNRNGVLLPRKLNGNFMLLSRPSDSGHTPFGDIFLSESPDLVYWGKHRHVMSKGGQGWWQSVKIGGGPAPIETTEGWLMFYHGVTGTCNGLVYSMGVAVLDLDDPSKVKYRSSNFVLTPEEWYEERGFVPNVVFPCATLHDADTGRIAIYYGAADTYVGIAYTTVSDIIKYVIATDEVVADDRESGRM
ncbi:glycoside hydrolase family 130 protein [Paenibacillus polymyxa]|uniref:glycoside hydrolase family 130 protein n=1 Tax=Paenibacillus TaxID=44249 RepID=UPI0005ED1B6A|nr:MULTISPECIES: glycoside hydrolase family 130 protein [Paenibacillus]AUS29142.1 glycosylase [Paenibacillus polymyxa]KAF6657066.1 glycoside hydrolase family 130 protein [Paenibacillus sp. EKM301P]KJK30177.1 glycosylase [Paenibacillus polymyxa]MDG0054684.1 glycoside hydrolase family 130 protein [Paenibacillus sp. P2(2022)]MEE4578503.1 glycoside hydrolase family 130 protein [Paenibacillus polymyxa]